MSEQAFDVKEVALLERAAEMGHHIGHEPLGCDHLSRWARKIPGPVQAAAPGQPIAKVLGVSCRVKNHVDSALRQRPADRHGVVEHSTLASELQEMHSLGEPSWTCARGSRHEQTRRDGRFR
jgi:hypothetical protein